jgi:4-hydroxy-tetrahydrodipicolinate reductase
MGRELIRAVHANEGCVLAGAIEQEGSIALGQDVGLLAGLGKLGVVITDDPLELFTKIDAVLDFTVPAASIEFAALAANARIVHVLGTTGMQPADDAKVEAAARHATIIKAGNMSLGVNLLTALTRKVAAALDADFDIEILEMHHRHKVDAPSGTALMLGKAAADGRGVNLDDASVRVRDGHTGERRAKRGDWLATVAAVVYEHSALFVADGEITDRAPPTERGISPVVRRKVVRGRVAAWPQHVRRGHNRLAPSDQVNACTSFLLRRRPSFSLVTARGGGRTPRV